MSVGAESRRASQSPDDGGSGAADLAADRSAADVAEGLAALRAGDDATAAEVYARLAERWRSVRDLRHAN